MRRSSWTCSIDTFRLLCRRADIRFDLFPERGGDVVQGGGLADLDRAGRRSDTQADQPG